MQSGIVTKARSKLRNVARGILPTASGWGTPPTNLGNATDGDVTTVTGTGTTTKSGAGNVGYVIINLGSIKTVLFGGKFSMWTSASTMDVKIVTSLDGNNWLEADSFYPNIRTASTSKSIYHLKNKITTTQYIGLLFIVNGAATANAEIYSIMAYELGI